MGAQADRLPHRGDCHSPRRPADALRCARVATRCPITTTAGTRTFACRTRLAPGAWVLVTQARAGSAVVASSRWRVKVGPRVNRLVPVTG